MSRRSILVIFCISFIGILLVWVFIPKNAPTPLPTFNPVSTPTTVPLPTANTSSLPSPTSQQGSTQELLTPTPSLERNDLIALLPIETPEYNIEYFARSDEIVVTIKQDPYTENRKKSEMWFTTKGITDFSKARITWTSLRFIQ